MSSTRTAMPKVSLDQLRILLEAIEKDPSLYNARDSDTYMNIKKWMDLADKLNNSPNGVQISVSNWKYVLRYWIIKTKRRRNMSEEKKREGASKLTLQQKKQLRAMEKKFKIIMHKNEMRELVDVTYEGTFDPVPYPGSDETRIKPEGKKFILHMVDIFSTEDEENAPPGGLKKRCIISKEKSDSSDPTGKIMKYKMVFDRVPAITDQESRKMACNKGRYRSYSAELTQNIARIQSRIQMIKALWLHRCTTHDK